MTEVGVKNTKALIKENNKRVLESVEEKIGSDTEAMSEEEVQSTINDIWS